MLHLRDSLPKVRNVDGSVLLRTRLSGAPLSAGRMAARRVKEMKRRAALVIGIVLPMAGCASSGRASKVDLRPAREAVESARQAGAQERAPEPFTHAQGHLNEAEALAVAKGRGAQERARQAEALSRLALAEAECALTIASLPQSRPGAAVEASRPTPTPAPESDLDARLRRSTDEQRRLEARVALLLKELDITETEVIRTKAKLKGLETKAAASSAIAEARILMKRVANDKTQTVDLSRCQQLLDRAEQQLAVENFGAAAFFALKAQDLLDETRRARADPAALDRPAPRKSYTVQGESVNIREGPSTTDPVIGRVAKGTVLEASVMRGDWVRVNQAGLSGWVYLPLLR